MDYEKKYKEALKRAKNHYSTTDSSADIKLIGLIFPELKECEDEKIRKALIEAIRNNYTLTGYINHIPTKDILAWLEKQGEHANFRNEIQVGDKVTRNEDGVLVNLSQLKRVAKKDEKQGEQKSIDDLTPQEAMNIAVAKCFEQGEQKPAVVIPKFRVGDVIRPKGSTTEYTIESISGGCYCGNLWRLPIGCDNDYELVEQKPADKVEPKFHEGEWITNGDYTWKIVEVKPLDYILQSQDGNIVDDTISHVDEQFHSFTIQDAKDGDVLSAEEGRPFIFKGLTDKNNPDSPVAYCGIDNTDYFYINDKFNNNRWTDGKVFPATKEQLDLLFKKMKEAGYEWDADKKELKKIEQKIWSEEDEENLNWFEKFFRAESVIAEGKGIPQDRYLWFKNLKGRVQTQQKQEWSEEDERHLNSVINRTVAYGDSSMHGLIKDDIDWLKSLKERYTWKPSDEQMEFLWKYAEQNNYDGSILTSLYNDLKKLKG